MITVDKTKLPGHLCYVLKTSVLEKAFSQAGIGIHTHVTYGIPPSGSPIFEARYRQADKTTPNPHLNIRVGVASSQEHIQASRALKTVALPKLVEWLMMIITEPADSTLFKHELYFNATYRNGEIRIQTSNG
jgi:hypothetical protein